jgi:signal transduction histidine kinase
MFAIMNPFFRLFFFALIIFTACKDTAISSQQLEPLETWHARFTRNKYNPDSTLFYAQLLEKKATNAPPEYRALIHLGYGYRYNNIAQYQLSRKSFSHAAQLLEGTPYDTIRARAYSGIGNAYKNLGKYDEAIDTLLLSARLFEKAGHNEGIAGSHISLAQVYQQKADLPNAKAQLRIVMQQAGSSHTNTSYLVALHTMANLYGMTGKIDSAMLIDRTGIVLADSAKTLRFKTPFLDNLANCYKEMGRYDSSRYYFNECLRMDSTLGEMKQVADSYLNLADLGLQEKNFVQAESDGKRSIALSNRLGYLYGKRNAWDVMSKIYAASGKFELALAAKDSCFRTNEKLINEKKESRIAELETIYESEKKEEQIVAKDKQLSQQRIIIAAVIVLFIALLLLGISYYRSYSKKKKNELEEALRREQEKATHAIFESELNERMRIARDLHDSVGQMLSVAKMQLSSQHAPAETLGLIDSTIQEVRTISHNLLPEELNFGIVRALEEMSEKINRTGSTKLTLEVPEEFNAVHFSGAFNLSVYRIIQEIASNMLRHAGASLITIALRAEHNLVHIRIADNGKGLEETQISGSKGIGWKNIAARVKLLEGKMSISSGNSGTTIAFTLPR